MRTDLGSVLFSLRQWYSAACCSTHMSQQMLQKDWWAMCVWELAENESLKYIVRKAKETTFWAWAKVTDVRRGDYIFHACRAPFSGANIMFLPNTPCVNDSKFPFCDTVTKALILEAVTALAVTALVIYTLLHLECLPSWLGCTSMVT